jgi:hypothetical protein
MARENARRDEILAQGKEPKYADEDEKAREKLRLGDREIHYRYQL